MGPFFSGYAFTYNQVEAIRKMQDQAEVVMYGLCRSMSYPVDARVPVHHAVSLASTGNACTSFAGSWIGIIVKAEARIHECAGFYLRPTASPSRVLEPYKTVTVAG